MVIDSILNRKDGKLYKAREFYQEMANYGNDEIAEAMDNGEEEDVKAELCKYIDEQGYNKEIKKYIKSQKWLK